MTFEEAFHEINGRAPTVEETKHALAIRRVVKEADLDPVLLFFLADANAAAERARLPGAVNAAVDGGVARFHEAVKTLPTDDEWNKAAAWAAWFAKALQVTTRTVTVAGIVIGVVLLAVTILGWRTGYAFGWADSQNGIYQTQAQARCAALDHLRHDLARHRNGGGAAIAHAAMVVDGCPP